MKEPKLKHKRKSETWREGMADTTCKKTVPFAEATQFGEIVDCPECRKVLPYNFNPFFESEMKS